LGINENLWAGFAVKDDCFNCFFTGDSGCVYHFKEIGDKLGTFVLTDEPLDEPPKELVKYL